MVDAIPPDAFRAFTTTVGLLTTSDGRGPNVMAAEWTFNVSYEPFLIMVVVRPHHATHGAIEATKEFGVSLCSEGQARQAHFAGSYSKDEMDKLSSEMFETYPATQIRAPLIKGAILNAECKLVGQFTVGDHTAFVGEVVAATWDPSKRPLVLHRGYRRISERIPKGEAVSVTATPMHATRGTTVFLAGELVAQSPAVGQEVVLDVRASDGNSGFRATATTDAEGFFEARWTVPADLAAGLHTVEATVGGVTGRARLVIA